MNISLPEALSNPNPSPNPDPSPNPNRIPYPKHVAGQSKNVGTGESEGALVVGVEVGLELIDGTGVGA